MGMTNSRSRPGIRWGFGLGSALLVSILVGSSVVAQEPPRFGIWDFGVTPRPSLEPVLLSRAAVRQELKISDAQARERAPVLRPEQQRRLDQIQLQAQGPLAFGPHNFPPAYEGDPLPERLKLSEDQVRRVSVIVREGLDEIDKAASFPIPLDSKEKPGEEAIGKLVDSPRFQAEKEKARRAGRDAWAVVIRRIEEVLTDPQRRAYRELLGDPFEVSKLSLEEQGRESDIAVVCRAFGGGGGGGGGGQGGGQRSDPNFDTKVARPAYADGGSHPRVLFDEAHHNFHTTSGRYKPFGQLIGNDGYQVIPNREKFSAEMLRKGDILVIANALGAEGMGQPGASDPAFTDAECDAVREWVRAGGSLLFLTDHAPMGAAAECLARRFEVNLSKGATSDPVNSEGGETSLVFSRQNRLLGDHPITRGRDESERVKKIQTFTGTSMKGPAASVMILKLADTAVDNSFDEEGKTTPAAGRAQGIALGFGKGRVVILGEAAEMSAQLIGDEKFGMNVPGLDNRQMALNIMHWLSGLLDPRKAD
jgi:hypothetical protein